MPNFIHLTLGDQVSIRINAEGISYYYPEEEDENRRVHTMVMTNVGEPLYVQEHASEIDRLINPTGTPR